MTWLRQHGFAGENLWEEWANMAEDEAGNLLSGWFSNILTGPPAYRMHFPKRPLSDWPGDGFNRSGRRRPGPASPLLPYQLYQKPHWPYIVPEPYASMYGPERSCQSNAMNAERDDPHPVYAAMQEHRVSRSFARDEVRRGR